MLDLGDREAIAALTGSRPYQLLIKEMESGVHEVLGALSNAKEDSEVLRLSRLWQVFFKYWQFLKDSPQFVRDELEKEMKEQPLMTYSNALPFERAKTLQQLEQLKTIVEGRNTDFQG